MRVSVPNAPELESASGDRLFGGSAEQSVLQVAEDIYVSLYDFGSSDEASRAASRVSPDGFSVPMGSAAGIAMVQWIGIPHFFLRDDLIVLHVEKQREDSAEVDSDVLAVLRREMGDEFAGNRFE